MKMLLCNKQKLNNKGMTLVEILVAIAILSAAIVPLLFAFVNVTRYNAEARELQQATALAQTVIENCKAYSVDDIDKQINGTPFTFMKNVSGHDKVSSGTDVTYYLTGVRVENQQYDVSLHLSPYEITNSDTFSYEMIGTEGMNGYKDAIFTVKTPTADASAITTEYLDYEAFNAALEEISAEIKAEAADPLHGIPEEVVLSGAEVLNLVQSQFEMERNIRILLTNSSGFEEVKVFYDYNYYLSSGEVKYVYTFEDGTSETITWTCGNGSHNAYSVEYTIYENENTVVNGASLENVYFCYYPVYNGSTGLTDYPYARDSITIENNVSKEVNVHLIKQINPGYTEMDLATLEASYEPSITGLGETIIMYHNLYENVADSAGTVPGVTLNGSIKDLMALESKIYSDADTTPTLYRRDNNNLMYSVDVVVYPKNSYDASVHSIKSDTMPIIKLSGTTLDW